MATITKRINKDGTTSYKVDVRLFSGGQLIGRKTKSFKSHREASAWAKRVEGQLESNVSATLDITLADLMVEYVEKMAAIKPLGRTRLKVIEGLRKRPRFSQSTSAVTVPWLVDFASERRAEGAGPATVAIDIGVIGAVFRDAGPVLGLALNDSVFREARPTLMRLGLVGKPQVRSRRPQSDELDRLMAALRLREKHHSSLLPMADMTEFLVYSCMRLGEMTGLLWADVDTKRKTVIIRNRKHPTFKQGNDAKVALLGPAWEILKRQPEVSDRVFPYVSRSVGTAFRRTVQQLGIEDLHLHDLRRHGISRLLERGFSVSEVASISGHKDIGILHRIYTNISPEHLHKKYSG